nr:PadR family transcriptional regulator [Bacillus niameyensis]
MTQAKLTSDLLRGHADTMILKLLLSGDKYGYEISKLIFSQSGDQFELKEATMYSSLKRLEKEGNIRSYWGDSSQGGRRKYYKITSIGEETYRKNKENWVQAKQILERLL